MSGDNKIVWASIILNVLLGVGLTLFIIFGRTKPIPKYEAEIATLTTLNDGLETQNTRLSNNNEASKDRVEDLEEIEASLTLELVKTNKIIEYLTNIEKNGKTDYVSKLSDDAIPRELTDYLKRRAAKRGIQ